MVWRRVRIHRLSSSNRTVSGKRRGRSERAAAATAGEGMMDGDDGEDFDRVMVDEEERCERDVVVGSRVSRQEKRLIGMEDGRRGRRWKRCVSKDSVSGRR